MAQELTPQDIKDIRAHYGLSQKAFARLLGLGEASLARYEKGHKPSKANANLIRAARLPRFVMDCLDRDEGALSEKERDDVREIVYAEVYFGEGDHEMDMTEIYRITLMQEVLNEKAAGLLAKLFTLRSAARRQGDDVRELVYTDIINQIAMLKPNIATLENSDMEKLAEIRGELDGFEKFVDKYYQLAA